MTQLLLDHEIYDLFSHTLNKLSERSLNHSGELSHFLKLGGGGNIKEASR